MRTKLLLIAFLLLSWQSYAIISTLYNRLDARTNQLEKIIGRELKQGKFRAMERKLEKLRKENEKLRDCGKYWHDACKETVRDLLGKRLK